MKYPQRSLLNMGGGEDPPALTPQQRMDWNRYTDWLESHKMRASPELDKQDVSMQWLNKYIKENPSTTLRPELIKPIQQEIETLAQNVRGFEARRGNPNADKLMQGTSKFDGIPGSKTTSFKFPSMDKEENRNGVLTSKTNFGIIDPRLRPTDSTTTRTSLGNMATAPNGASLEKMADGKFYYKNKDGDYVQYNK